MAAGVVLLVAGSLQLTGWKVRQVARCWEALACADSARVNGRGAWHQGLRLGAHCSLCCSAYMILLLLSGMMNLGVMALVAAAITIERVSPAPRRVARAAEVVIILTAAVLLTSPGYSSTPRPRPRTSSATATPSPCTRPAPPGDPTPR